MRVPTLTKFMQATLFAGLLGTVAGFWRMPCRGRVGLARIDPLVNFNEIAPHIHSIHGSSGFSINAGYKDLIDAKCTSCQVTQDKSVYWHPSLYFQGADGKYYLLNYSPGSTSITAFPEGFEMLAGDTNQRNFTYPVPDVEKSLWTGEFADQAFLRQAAIGFNCLNYQKTPEGTLYRHFLPDKAYLDANCVDGVRFELMFPSCWNGKDVTTKDKKSHVAYPSQVMAGTCPDDFPVRLPSLLYETIWATNAFAGKDGKFIISNGDPTGTSSLSLTCTLGSLPGDPSIQYGPAYAQKAKAADPVPIYNGDAVSSPVPVPTLAYTPGASLHAPDTFVPGAIYAATDASTSSSSPSPPPPAPAPMTSSPAAYYAAEKPAPPPTPITSPPGLPVAAQTTDGVYTVVTELRDGVLEVMEYYLDVVTVTAYAQSPHKRHLHKHRRGGHHV
ncbi:hypothetical protein BUE80_DR001264 [Diplocarpon rosae]|nr:hypothetical protein BUE80_DR001264 [Diplocarpon rosae]